MREAPDVSAVLSVGKVLAVVEALLQTPSALSARAIGERSGVNRTTAHRLLNTLILHGWVERAVHVGRVPAHRAHAVGRGRRAVAAIRGRARSRHCLRTRRRSA